MAIRRTSGVEAREVAPEEANLRLDRWFRRHFPGLSHAHLQRLLRTGQIRVDGARAKAGLRLVPGQRVRIPPLGDLGPQAERTTRAVKLSRAEVRRLRESVLYRDEGVVAINKPPGLAVQGGTGTRRHLDQMLDALRFEAPERPRLVHRLDKDTSGVLVLARGQPAAAALAKAFRRREVKKVYWALVVGRPPKVEGRVDLKLTKRPGRGGERVAPDSRAGRRAVTLYRVVRAAGRRATWLALLPLTGRTHQLRAHCAALGTPIIGDGKYGGRGAFLQGEGVSSRLHLHAREVELPHPRGGRLHVTAPLPD
ncbi:MAG: RluA family pseudouridine synthase, partial [Alphaproteobacteria bacterium]